LTAQRLGLDGTQAGEVGVARHRGRIAPWHS
jgi:hypothetical protein